MTSVMTFIYPELILVTGALLVLMTGAFGLKRRTIGLIAFLTVLAAALALPGTADVHQIIFSRMLINDVLGLSMRYFILLALGLAVLMAIATSWPDDSDAGEYYFFLLIAAVSMTLAVTAGNLMVIYLTVETLSIVSYLLACFYCKDLFSTEAGLKYFLFGALSTGLMLYGISLAYGIFHSLDLSVIGGVLAAGNVNSLLLITAAVLIFAGLAFKASLVPFHMWVADVYEGAPWPVAAFFSIGPKALGFALMVRIFLSYPAFMHSGWGAVAVFLAIATMTAGNLAAFHQSSVKRVLAFSSVAQAGYIFAGMATGSLGLKAAFFYIVIYAFMNMGAFASAAFLSTGRSTLESFQGLSRRSPSGALIFSIFLLSLAGLPPLAGFLAKFFVVWTALETRHFVLAGAVMANSVIAFFYYLKIIKAMYFDQPSTTEPLSAINIPLTGKLLLVICLLMVIYLGIHPQPVMNILLSVFK
ncbi:MAG: NADH-quinone oxidoreductase subunit N [Candidatus Omnitrophica bacterium]|nr:NADH-quinone oxidoreductase subunit N [Candidatus Omnitrophota bacterium]